MKTITKLVLCGTLTVCSALCSAVSFAQNKVVVIPMSGTDAKPLANIVTVAKENGDFTDPVAAVESITDAGPGNPYLVVIAPGVYTVASPVLMKPFVDVSGSGQNATVVVGSVSTPDPSDSAVFEGSRASSIRSLTVRHTSTAGNNAVGFHLLSDNGFSIDDVKIEVDGVGNNYGFYASLSSFSLSNSIIALSDGDVRGVDFNAASFNSYNNQFEISDCTVASGIYVGTGDANIIGNRINIDRCSSNQHGIYVNSGVDAVVSGSSIDIDSDLGSKYGIFSNASSKGLYTGLRISVVGDAGSKYGIYSNTSGNRSRITGVDISASTAAVRSSSSISASAGHTFISNSVFRAGVVSGQPTKLHCSHVFDESVPTAPVELQSDCS